MSAAPKPVDPSINGWNAEYLESQYQRWRENPAQVPGDLRQFFQGFDLAQSGRLAGLGPATGSNGFVGGTRASEDRAQAAVSSLIEHYRRQGHICAAIDPFGRERVCPESLKPQFHGLGESDLDRTFDAGSLSDDGQPMPLRDIIAKLDDTYCGPVGVEFMHISIEEEVEWLAHRMEQSRNRPNLSRQQKAHVLFQLHKAELFELFCGKRYPGIKRFSLEGGESLIPLLDWLIERSGDDFDVEEIVFAMSHRGRLNVLTNIIGKTYEQIFTEFEDSWSADAELGGGDVKYHRGYSANRILPSGKHVWLAMASNPSHLESACPVALGRCRAKQRLRGDTQREKVICVLLHGDAAVIGQGVIAETYNLSRLDGYTVGGTIHVVINNLIGFTTGKADARSSRYCTDIAKMIEAPIFHVNGEDPEAVIHVAQMAIEYRMKFKKDVVIDMVCYRRHGHNETDEASFTQPLLYKEIKNRTTVLEDYTMKLFSEKVISEDDKEKIRLSLDEELDKAYLSARQSPVDPTPDPGHRRWTGFSHEWSFDPVDTGVPTPILAEIAEAMGRVPEGFNVHRKLVRILEARGNVVSKDEPFDWAIAESFAVGSLLLEGDIVRFSGQDSRRGTFSHRHAVIRDVETGEAYCPLNHIRELGMPGTDKDVGTKDAKGRPRQAKYCIYDSPLSEYSVLGFEYGFSLVSPSILALWEAQFGDFCNGAQVIIDQFIASAEAKWQRWSGLTLLLPHGYEGQGPEHSSARLERFLKLCGRNNMQVCYPTTPAQYFHMLRRQMKRNFRKPLIVMTPKSLLRLPASTSRIDEINKGRFLEIIDDPAFTTKAQKKKVERLILCSGKVYYDLIKRREEIHRHDLAIVRIEQLYPLHLNMLEQIVSSYPEDIEMVWVQEEPKNMGAWGHMMITLYEVFGWDLPYIGRPPADSPATGSPRKHQEELEALLAHAVGTKEAVAAGAA